MKFKVKYRYRQVTNEMITADIMRVAKKLRKNIVTCNEYRQLGRFSDGTVTFRFGSWNNAVKASGLDVSANRRVTKDELLENIALVWMTLERQPACDEMKRPLSEFSYSSYAKHFGSWTKSLEAFEKFIKNGGLKKALAKAKHKKKILQPKRFENSKHAKPCNRKTSVRKSRRISNHIRYLVLKRDSFRCCLCGSSPAIKRGVLLHVDHIKP